MRGSGAQFIATLILLESIERAAGAAVRTAQKFVSALSRGHAHIVVKSHLDLRQLHDLNKTRTSIGGDTLSLTVCSYFLVRYTVVHVLGALVVYICEELASTQSLWCHGHCASHG
jgi:hypothetical protein